MSNSWDKDLTEEKISKLQAINTKLAESLKNLKDIAKIVTEKNCIDLTNVTRERDEALSSLSEWENAKKAVERDSPDEKHCVCAYVLRKKLNDLEATKTEIFDRVRIDHILDQLERVADLLPMAWDVTEIDEAQRIVMNILCEEARFERVGVFKWKKINKENNN